MDSTHRVHDEQAALWNGRAGAAWVESQELLDDMLRPFEELLVKEVVARSASRVLDVGCGTGSTTVAIARKLEARADCTGVDISQPMIAAAQRRAAREGARATFVRADAQTHRFEPASFDIVVSRFGVMFFNDSVQAFANLRRAAMADAQLCFVAWRSPSENPFMTTAERTAASLLPNVPARQADGPGQFAFADRQRVSTILERSGWTDIDIRPIDATCKLPEREMVRYVTRLGPLGLLLEEVDSETQSKVIDAVRAAFDPYVDGEEVRFTAACWSVSARAPAATTSA